jgi:LCP family protein required for cell wall assembly
VQGHGSDGRDLRRSDRSRVAVSGGTATHPGRRDPARPLDDWSDDHTFDDRPARGRRPDPYRPGDGFDRPSARRPAGGRPDPGRSDAGRAAPTRFPAPRPRRPPGRIGRRIRIATALLAAVVLGVTGLAWQLYRDVTAGITTTDIIAPGWGGDGQNILLVGVDSRTDAQGNALPAAVLSQLHSGPDTGVINSDTIMLLHVPADGGAAVAFSIPRDSYVSIPGHGRDKINAAYPGVKAATAERLVADGESDPGRIETQSAEAGRRALVETVEELTGRTIDHYAEVNLYGFHTLTTTIGGVEVCLKAPVNDPLSGARFAAGPQTISGAAALAFVRQRHGLPEGDLSRIRRQQVFLAAVADKVLSSHTLTDPTKLAGLISVLQSALVIDADWDLLAFARQASDIAAGNLRFLTIPTRGPETNDRGDVVLVDEGDVHDFVDNAIEEQQAAAEASQDAPKPPPPLTGLIPERYVVDVRNASDAVGLAAAVANHVRDLGFEPGTVDNSAPLHDSVVRYTGADEDAADKLAEQLGGIDVQSDEEVTPGHLMVTLGAGFDPGRVPQLARTLGRPAPPADPTNITAAGVPCID